MLLSLKTSPLPHVLGQIVQSSYFLAAIATIVTFLGAVLVIRQSITGSDFILHVVLRRTRARTVCETLYGFGVSRSLLTKANRDITDFGAKSGEKPTVQTEIKWISDVAGDSDSSWAGPFELNGVSHLSSPSAQLYALSEAYDRFSTNLKVHILFSSNRRVSEQQELASQMARYLKMNANFRSSRPKEFVKLKVEIPRLRVDLEMFTPRLSFSPSYHVDHVAVIHKHERILVPESTALASAQRDKTRAKPIQLTRRESERLSSRLSSRTFDGVLPALHAPRLQLDPHSGHLRLLLELSEITYSAVQAMNFVGEANGVGRSYDELIKKSNGMDRLFTLAMVPVSTDGYLMAAQRSSHVGVGKLKFAPAVNGNLELRDRLGLSVDRDGFGLPDPLSAIAREAKEELGLNVEVSDIQILGLDKFSYAEEVGTWVLTTSVLTKNSAKEIVEMSKRADQIEGAWETTGDFLALPLPRNQKSAEELVKWAINSSELVPHLILAILAICLPFLSSNTDTTTESLKEKIASLRSDEFIPMPTGTRKFGRTWIEISKYPAVSIE